MEYKIGFTRSEIQCFCGCGFAVEDRLFIHRLSLAQLKYGRSFIITDWCRCAESNRKKSRSIFSPHLRGIAAHIEVFNDLDRFKVVKALIITGFKRLVVTPKHIHVDTDQTKDLWCFRVEV